MVVNKRKKVGKYRGYSTHGCGSRKKRRGSGSKGGTGNAGTGKRAGQKKASKYCKVLGKFGFKRGITLIPIKIINVGYFTAEKLQHLVQAGKVVQEKDIYLIDLANLGYNKLLGMGKVYLKLKIKADSFSAQAEEKVKAAGGSIVGTEE